MANKIIGWEAAYRKRPSGNYGKNKPHQDAEFLDDFFRKHQVKRILDLGCGDGRHLVYFAKCDYKMYGLDIAPTAIRLAKEWLAKEKLSAKLVCTDMSTIPWSNSFFDAIICVQTINHHRIKEIRRTIREIYRALRPGGWFFLTVGTSRPSKSDLTADGKFIEVEPNTYIWMEGREKGVLHHFFNMEELLKEFSEFDIVDLRKKFPLVQYSNLHKDCNTKTCMFAQKPHTILTHKGDYRRDISHKSR